MTRGLLDTSIFVARESRGIDEARLPDELAVSVVTHAELTAGVLATNDTDIRARRLTTLTSVAAMNPIPIDIVVAEAWARLRVHLAGAKRRVNINDTWIAATAMVLGVPVVSQDRDFDVMADVAGLLVIHV